MTADVYQPETWSAGEMMIEYARHHGYGEFTVEREAWEAIRERQPKFAQLLLVLIRDDSKFDQIYEFLSRPPTLVVNEETDEVVLTEHGRSMGEAYGEKL